MKILQINKYFRSKGGAESYLFDLINLLEKNRQTVLMFSQNHPNNLPSREQKYFIADLDLSKLNWSMFFKLGRMFWPIEARKKIKQLIADEKPDIVHIHNIYHQISPSILPTIKKLNLPIVMTVHDFKLIKPDYTLRADNKSGKKSIIAKLILNLEFNFHKILKTYQKNIDCFIAPSQFVKDRLVENGFNPAKIEVIPHFIDLKKYKTGAKTENYLTYFGRLDESKGIDTLIKAFDKIRRIKLKLKIIGDGPQERELKNLVKKLGLMDQIEFMGRRSKKNLAQIVGQSLAVVCPSRVHETFGLTVLEAFALGKPVIGSKVGAYPELIKPEQTGLLFEVDNVEELAQQIKKLFNNQFLAKQMGINCLNIAKKYTPENHYKAIMKVYKKIQNSK